MGGKNMRGRKMRGRKMGLERRCRVVGSGGLFQKRVFCLTVFLLLAVGVLPCVRVMLTPLHH